MTTPLHPARDDLETAQALATELLTLARQQGADAAVAAWSGSPNPQRSPVLLALGAAIEAADPIPALATVAGQLTDTSWAEAIARRLARARHLGVGSIGLTTRVVLEAVESLDRDVPMIVAPTRAIARGLSYLNLPIGIGDLAAADTVLIPGIAQHGSTVWTTPLLADAAVQAGVSGSRRVAAVHPLGHLDTAATRRFRPPAGIVPTVV